MIAVNGKMFSSIATKTRKAKLENIFLFLCAEKDQLQKTFQKKRPFRLGVAQIERGGLPAQIDCDTF